jgi:hypothetical protein
LHMIEHRFDFRQSSQDAIHEFALTFIIFSQPLDEPSQQVEIGFCEPVDVPDDIRRSGDGSGVSSHTEPIPQPPVFGTLHLPLLG